MGSIVQIKGEDGKGTVLHVKGKKNKRAVGKEYLRNERGSDRGAKGSVKKGRFTSFNGGREH